MATSTFANMYGKEKFERLLADVCIRHRLDRKDFLQAEMNQYSGRLMLSFKPRRASAAAHEACNAVQAMLRDPFRSEVIRAAVPEFSSRVEALIDAVTNPKPEVVHLDLALHNSDGRYSL